MKIMQPIRRRRHSDASTTNTETTPEVESDVLTLAEAASYLRCHSKTLRLMAIARKIPGKRVGYHWRFYRPSLEAWLQQAA
jgi:excisionase family DNA binding protein